MSHNIELWGSTGTTFTIPYSGTKTTDGGDEDEVISVSGVLTTDIAIVFVKTPGTNQTFVIGAASDTNQIIVKMSADPGNDTVLQYLIIRSA